MEKIVILFNGLADNGKGFENAKELKKFVPEAELQFEDLTKIDDLVKFFSGFENSQKFILSGGDGTVNHFINEVAEKDIPEDLLYFPAGTGNDLYRELAEREATDGLVPLKKYLVGLPTATINGKSYKFFNGIGYGIDGYCCEVADQLKAKSDKPINYAGIAVKGLLFFFKPRGAKITVDGKEYNYKHVWLAPVMKGKYYGGGMIPCPAQDRNGEQLSCLVWHCAGKLKTLLHFSSIFKGEHLNKNCEVITGKNFIVEFEKPCAAQVDGETVLNVSKVEVKA